MSPRFDLRTSAKVLLLIATVSAVWAVTIAIVGGVDSRVFGVRLSSRDPYRATMIALLTGITGINLLAHVNARFGAVVRTATRLRFVLVAGLAMIVSAIGWQSGSRTAGGADSYGYVSQAYLWLQGEPRVHQPLAQGAPWPNADWAFSPLGYRPSTTPHTLVPIYPPGLPLIMAGFILAFGSCGAYAVTPIASGVLVILTYVLGRRVSGVGTGVIAALLMATSPTLLFCGLMPMSDVPAATLWTASLLLSFATSTWSAIGCGGLAGIAILVRPNLAPLIVVPLLNTMWRSGAIWPASKKALIVAGACAPGVLAAGAVNAYLFGSALESGYGSAWSLYAIGNIRANLQRYPVWLFQTQGAFAFLFLLAILRVGQHRDPTAWRALFLLFIALVGVPYLLYYQYDAWWFLRFLLPAFPAMFILTADAMQWMTSRIALPWRQIAVMTGCALMVFHALRYASEEVTGHPDGEQRYAEVGRYIAQNLPPKSVCFSMQHSGSIRHYSPCITLRYDSLEPEWLHAALGHAVSRGYHPFVVVDKWEEESFRQRFQQLSPIGSLRWTPLAVLPGPQEVRIYDVLTASLDSDQGGTVQIPTLPRKQCLGPWSAPTRALAGWCPFPAIPRCPGT